MSNVVVLKSEVSIGRVLANNARTRPAMANALLRNAAHARQAFQYVGGAPTCAKARILGAAALTNFINSLA
jgi:hypothetical protein